ncbi:MAG: hypothetical protein MI922_11340, partial [Bacteroidales bacterium]|nr:hypothetical protein [Bacteroidales bacterium]
MKLIAGLLFCFTTTILYSQLSSSIYSDLQIRSNRNYYSSRIHYTTYDSTDVMYFNFKENDQTVELKIKTKEEISELELQSSRDFEVIDSLMLINGEYTAKLRYYNLVRTEYLKLVLKAKKDTANIIEVLGLMPVTETKAGIQGKNKTLFIGEERVFEILSNNPENIIAGNEWIIQEDYEYRLTEKNNRINLHIIPNRLGNLNVSIPITCRKPNIDNIGNLTFDLSPTNWAFEVKASRLQFLKINK